jgi:hypothetical protein
LELSNNEISRGLTQLARKMGKDNASSLLSALGRDKQFLNAIETSLGQELLKDATSSIENIISLILQEKDEPKDRAELAAYLNITNKWQKMINRYNKNKGTFDKNIN